MRLLFIADIVGQPGRRAVQHFVPLLRQREKIDVVIANGEAAGPARLKPAPDGYLLAGHRLWSNGPAAASAFGALCVLLFGLAIGSAIVLLVRAAHPAECKLVYGMLMLLPVLLAGAFMIRTDFPQVWAFRRAATSAPQ